MSKKKSGNNNSGCATAILFLIVLGIIINLLEWFGEYISALSSETIDAIAFSVFAVVIIALVLFIVWAVLSAFANHYAKNHKLEIVTLNKLMNESTSLYLYYNFRDMLMKQLSVMARWQPFISKKHITKPKPREALRLLKENENLQVHSAILRMTVHYKDEVRKSGKPTSDSFYSQIEGFRARMSAENYSDAKKCLAELRQYEMVAGKIEEIDSMEGHDFEYWCADLLRKNGFSNVEVTPGSGDQGVDIVAVKSGIRYAVQCKCYSSDLGNTPVQEVYAGKEMYHCHVGVVMTNRYFTKGAKELAQQTGVLLWDRDVLASLLAKLSGTTQEPVTSKKPVSPPAPAETGKYNGPEIPIPSTTLFPQSAPKIEAVPLRVESVKEKLQGMSLDYHFVDAVDLVTDTNMVSVSMIQRRLKLGYSPAAQMIDTMEAAGIVGPFNGSTPRTVLVTSADWTQIKKEMGL